MGQGVSVGNRTSILESRTWEGHGIATREHLQTIGPAQTAGTADEENKTRIKTIVTPENRGHSSWDPVKI